MPPRVIPQARPRPRPPQPRNLRPGRIPIAVFAPTSSASVTIVRYPAAIDTPPSPVNNQTPLTGTFHNYLALMIEAIEAEVGTMQDVYGTHGSLMAFLGTQFNDRLSNWRAISKPFGGEEAGQVYGILKRNISKTASLYGTAASTTLTTNQGVHPTNKTPVVFCQVEDAAASVTDIINSVGGGVRGNAVNVGGNTVIVNYRGHPSDASASSSGSNPVNVNILVFFPWEGA